ncbi:MAG: hypothetical protein AW10_00315 [Candidatus Accumulibacter appositus]|uniref:Uncharacterized protein n=1 Tax=Candidatus Accumulibacter appositus TaxID=1454003 RepID=A0A011Q121_9PROT|nr:MAG: hypothetical protein AW10_00315 [Candidatus Accumulibacter appositus]
MRRKGQGCWRVVHRSDVVDVHAGLDAMHVRAAAGGTRAGVVQVVEGDGDRLRGIGIVARHILDRIQGGLQLQQGAGKAQRVAAATPVAGAAIGRLRAGGDRHPRGIQYESAVRHGQGNLPLIAAFKAFQVDIAEGEIRPEHNGRVFVGETDGIDGRRTRQDCRRVVERRHRQQNRIGRGGERRRAPLGRGADVEALAVVAAALIPGVQRQCLVQPPVVVGIGNEVEPGIGGQQTRVRRIRGVKWQPWSNAIVGGVPPTAIAGIGAKPDRSTLERAVVDVDAVVEQGRNPRPDRAADRCHGVLALGQAEFGIGKVWRVVDCRHGQRDGVPLQGKGRRPAAGIAVGATTDGTGGLVPGAVGEVGGGGVLAIWNEAQPGGRGKQQRTVLRDASDGTPGAVAAIGRVQRILPGTVAREQAIDGDALNGVSVDVAGAAEQRRDENALPVAGLVFSNRHQSGVASAHHRRVVALLDDDRVAGGDGVCARQDGLGVVLVARRAAAIDEGVAERSGRLCGGLRGVGEVGVMEAQVFEHRLDCDDVGLVVEGDQQLVAIDAVAAAVVDGRDGHRPEPVVVAHRVADDAELTKRRSLMTHRELVAGSASGRVSNGQRRSGVVAAAVGEVDVVEEHRGVDQRRAVVLEIGQRIQPR